MPKEPKVHPVDLHVGLAIRARRREMGISQPQLGEMLGGLSFQQIQKYERGGNRISASRLYEVGRALKVPVGYFFAGLDDEQLSLYSTEVDSNVSDLLTTPEGQDLLKAFPKLEGSALRRQLVELVKAITAQNKPSES